jgi:periplasmic copper chaperone A
MKHLSILLLIMVLLTGCGGKGAVSGGSQAGDIQIRDAWARPGLAGGNSAVYFVIDNQGAADTLLKADCPSAGMSELHISKMDDDGTMTMEHQDDVPAPAGEKVEFKPGGLHVMLMNLKEDVKIDQKLSCTLSFEKAGTVQVEAPVREP